MIYLFPIDINSLSSPGDTAEVSASPALSRRAAITMAVRERRPDKMSGKRLRNGLAQWIMILNGYVHGKKHIGYVVPCSFIFYHMFFHEQWDTESTLNMIRRIFDEQKSNHLMMKNHKVVPNST